MENKNVILFNSSKNELFKVNDNYKILHRKLKTYWKIVVWVIIANKTVILLSERFIVRNKEEISTALLKNISLLILPSSQHPFEETEINAIKAYLNEGGKILVLLAESNQDDLSNINIILEEFGIYPEMGTCQLN